MGKRNKSYYAGNAKRFKGAELQQGAVGFIFSFVRGRERQAKNEAYELLNSYAADMPGQELAKQNDSDEDDNGSEEDIDAALDKQLTKLKDRRKQTEYFSYQDAGVNQIMFMKALMKNHNALTYKILEDARSGELKKQNRALHRILPVLSSCRADVSKIGDCVLNAVEIYLEHDVPTSVEISYKCIVKVRNNNDTELKQQAIIKAVGEAVRSKYSSWKVDLDDPLVCICVDILKKVCCISVLRDYSKYRKFNLQELVVDQLTEKTLDESQNRVKGGKGSTPSDAPTDASSGHASSDVAAEALSGDTESNVAADIPTVHTESNVAADIPTVHTESIVAANIPLRHTESNAAADTPSVHTQSEAMADTPSVHTPSDIATELPSKDVTDVPTGNASNILSEGTVDTSGTPDNLH